MHRLNLTLWFGVLHDSLTTILAWNKNHRIGNAQKIVNLSSRIYELHNKTKSVKIHNTINTTEPL
jgi:hypothetical protein